VNEKSGILKIPYGAPENGRRQTGRAIQVIQGSWRTTFDKGEDSGAGRIVERLG
jgi:hypothetical protein